MTVPFPIPPNAGKSHFKALIAEYWTDLSGGIQANQYIKATDKSQLVEDYCRIGKFLANTALVESCLEPLETSIRQTLLVTGRDAAFPKTTAAAIPYVTRKADEKMMGPTAALKAHKLLSNALRESEALAGFNHEKLVNGTFFDDAVTEGTLHGGGAKIDPTDPARRRLTPAGRGAANKVRLPSGVPTVHSYLGGLDGRSFQQVLLRHGYQFKDLGAGPYHGEYSHRLQWYAILHAQRTGRLQLVNKPIEIFKSLGYTVCGADKVAQDDRHLYVWEMLFDCGTSDENAIEVSGTLAFCSRTYNSPEILNKNLMNRVNRSFANLADLWCLRVLVSARYKKRVDNLEIDAPDPLRKAKARLDAGTVRDLMSGDMLRTKDAAGAKLKTPVTLPVPSLEDASYALVWYLRN